MTTPPISSMQAAKYHAAKSHPALPQRPTYHSTMQSLTKHEDSTSVSFFSCFQSLWNQLITPFVCIYRWLFGTPASKPISSSLAEAGSVTASKWPIITLDIRVDPKQNPFTIKKGGDIQHPNKIVCYNHLLENRNCADLGAPRVIKCGLGDRSEIAACPLLWGNELPHFEIQNGFFSYPPSNQEKMHWTLNMADHDLMAYYGGALLAQDELQGIEHPTLLCVRAALRKLKRSFLYRDEICLAIDVPRLGNLDTQSAAPGAPKGIYGNAFGKIKDPNILLSKLTRFEKPTLSNIFFMAAPPVGYDFEKLGKPYEKPVLEEMFYSAFVAFKSIKDCSKLYSNSCLIHTGNWGAGAFGNNATVTYLVQIAAAYAAGVDVRFYPSSKQAYCDYAFNLFNHILTEHPQMTVDAFLTHLAIHAAEYQLLYQLSDGT